MIWGRGIGVGRTAALAAAALLALAGLGLIPRQAANSLAAINPVGFAKVGNSIYVANAAGAVAVWRGATTVTGSLEGFPLNAPVVDIAGRNGGFWLFRGTAVCSCSAMPHISAPPETSL